MAARVPIIGIFDSGVGGLTIFQAVRERLPQAFFCYLSDNGNFPYGVKSEADVLRCTLDATQRFISRFGLDLLIIACNTASTIALERLRQRHTIPVIGVVPAIKPAVQMSRSRTIGLLATPGTISRPYTDTLIRDFASGARVLKCGSGLLVKLAEAKLKGEVVQDELVRQEVMPLFAASPTEDFKRLDTIVLGCTHFPLLKEELTRVVPWPVQWVDSSQAIAARAAHLLTEETIPGSGGDKAPTVGSVAGRGDTPSGIGPFGVTRLDADAQRFDTVVKAYGFSGITLV